MLSDTNWYVIQVNSGDEEVVKSMIIQELSKEQVEYENCFVPLIERIRIVNGRTETRIRPMFLGYVFLVTNEIEKARCALMNVILFTRILGADGSFVSLDRREVEFLLNFAETNYNITTSYGVIENDKVIVCSGPLVGKEGFIKKINRHKRIAEIEVSFMNRETRIYIPLEIVSKA